MTARWGQFKANLQYALQRSGQQPQMRRLKAMRNHAKVTPSRQIWLGDEVALLDCRGVCIGYCEPEDVMERTA